MSCISNRLLGLLAIVLSLVNVSHAFWRMSCSLIQTGRLDPIVNPGVVASHVHKVSGASNFGPSNTYNELIASKCTSCEVGDDKSAYWTPQLYYRYANGSYVDVPNGGTVVYYLGRGENKSNIEPFPPGFKLLSGDTRARSADTGMTYSNSAKGIRGRPISDRVSFACLHDSPIPQQNYMFRTDCKNGMRAQIHFQSCWDGRDYQTDQSHVAYMSGIDNGHCPPSHPRQLMHLFFEVIYGVNDVKKETGGKFVFANGDPTGYGFHADFMNGWDATTLKNAIAQCANNDAINGQISKCPPLAKTLNSYTNANCPERASIVNEKVKGMLSALPGCNPVSDGPARAPVPSCPGQTTPSMNAVGTDRNQKMFNPNVGDKLVPGGGWVFSGCAVDNGNPRPLNSASSASDTAMTIDTCTATCKAKGFKLAGLEFGKQCFCGSTLAAGVVGNCGSTPLMACSGNSSQWCGAPSILNVWTDNAYVAPSVLVPGTSSVANGTGKYFGCYTEAGRTLGDSSWVNDAVSVTTCAKYCQDGNFAMFGVEYGRECYCGNNIKSTAAKAAEGDCKMNCKGNTTEVCGGSSRISMWNNTMYVPRRNLASVNGGQYGYLGCYTEGNKG